MSPMGKSFQDWKVHKPEITARTECKIFNLKFYTRWDPKITGI
jgi:hypothetical protein